MTPLRPLTPADAPAPRPVAIAIGASAGALAALSEILPVLPADYPLPILIVVHVPPDRHNLLAELLQAKCQIAIREVEDKEPIVAGTAFLAPPGYHLLVDTGDCLSLSVDDPVNYSRPSIDVLFESAADVFGPGLTGIVLTGASQDGAHGLAMIHDAGGTCLVQRPDLAYASTMPSAAIEACPSARSLTLEEIAASLLDLAKLV